jgi:hypothetical protein
MSRAPSVGWVVGVWFGFALRSLTMWRVRTWLWFRLAGLFYHLSLYILVFLQVPCCVACLCHCTWLCFRLAGLFFRLSL